MKKKELQNILSNHDQSYQSLQQSLNIYTKNGQHQQREKFRGQSNRISSQIGGGDNSVLGGPPGMVTGASSQNDHLTPLKGGKADAGVRGQHGPHGHHILNNNAGGNPLGGASVYSTKHNAGAKHHRGSSVDALNSSVEMRGAMKHHLVGGKTKHPREQSVRISRFNGNNSDDGLVHNSVHDFERAKNKAQDQLESLSVSGSHHQSKDPGNASYMRKSHHEIAKQNAHHSQSPAGDQQAGEGGGEKLSKDIQLNLQNLLQIDDKLTQLAECLKKNTVGNISQLCSDWWEYTDEDEYTIAKFQKAYRDEKARREIKQMMGQEILSIAIVNYFTSSPEIFRPSSIQLSQVKSVLGSVHQNFLAVVEFLLSKLPQEAQQNQFSAKLHQILKQKRKKQQRSSSKGGIPQGDTLDRTQPLAGVPAIKAHNDSIMNALKTITRQVSQAGGNARGANLSAKKLIALRNQGMIKNQSLIQSQALKPLYQTVQTMLKQMDNARINQVREAIIKSSETIEDLKLAAK